MNVMFLWAFTVSALSLRPASRASKIHAAAGGTAEILGRSPATSGDVLRLGLALQQLQASPLSVAELTESIDQAGTDASPSALETIADFLKRQRRSQLLVDLLKSDRAAYIETATFLPIPRRELPNRQDIPLRACDTAPRRADALPETVLIGGLTADGLVPDSPLADKAMGENGLEAAILELTRDIYSKETGVSRSDEKGIRGLIDEMRRFMLSSRGASPAAQQEVLIRTLRVLMTPVLPPFYRIFMGGKVPTFDPRDERIGADPQWLADGFSWVGSSVHGFMPRRSLLWWPRMRSASSSVLRLSTDAQTASWGGSSWRSANSCRSPIARACASIRASCPPRTCLRSSGCLCA